MSFWNERWYTDVTLSRQFLGLFKISELQRGSISNFNVLDNESVSWNPDLGRALHEWKVVEARQLLCLWSKENISEGKDVLRWKNDKNELFSTVTGGS